MLRAVSAIDIMKGSRDVQETGLDAIRGEKVADDWRQDERLHRIAADPDRGVEAANPSGTFEALMGGWGSPHRPAFDTSLPAD